MENLGGILVRQVYEGGKQYTNILKIKVAILHFWNLLDISTLQRLCTSLSGRLLKVVSCQEAAIYY